MKRKTIIIIILTTSMAMLGMILTQVYWVNNALKLKEEQFDNGVRLAMKSVVNQLLQNKNDTVFQERLTILSCRKSRLDVFDYIEPEMLDSLVTSEISCMKLNVSYYYGIYNRNNDRFAMGDYKGNEQMLLTSPYQFSVSSIYKIGDYYLSIYFPAKTTILIRMLGFWLTASFLFLLIMILSFIFVTFKLLQQKKISAIKTDFINNMTHEFKTPIATSSLAAEMIQRPEVLIDAEKIKRYAGIILDESNRLQNQIEQVLQVATIELEGPRLKMKKINIHHLLESVIESFDLRIKERGAILNSRLQAGNMHVLGDKFHLLNVFYNLLDNALKYTPADPVIDVETSNNGNKLIIRFKDNGIGIDQEHQKDIFKNLFRVPTGNIHEVRGFGLGLYYVKNIVNNHQGEILLKSQPGKGSVFEVHLNTIE